MKKKIVCILVMALLIATTVLPIVSTINIYNTQEVNKLGDPDYYSKPTQGLNNNLLLPPWLLKLVLVLNRIHVRAVYSDFGNDSGNWLCRWVGGGTIGTNRDPRVTHGFQLHCNVEELPNNLEVNLGGDHFHLNVLTAVECSDDPAIDPRPPRAGCDTIHGWGEGKYNNISGFHVEFIFTDAGEPGRVDWAWIYITDSDGDSVMEVSGFLKSGNQQAIC